MFQTKGILGNNLKVQKEIEKNASTTGREEQNGKKMIVECKAKWAGTKFFKFFFLKRKQKTQKLKDIWTAKIGIKKGSMTTVG